jgi:hypothetical protein
MSEVTDTVLAWNPPLAFKRAYQPVLTGQVITSIPTSLELNHH